MNTSSFLNNHQSKPASLNSHSSLSELVLCLRHRFKSSQRACYRICFPSLRLPTMEEATFAIITSLYLGEAGANCYSFSFYDSSMPANKCSMGFQLILEPALPRTVVTVFMTKNQECHFEHMFHDDTAKLKSSLGGSFLEIIEVCVSSLQTCREISPLHPALKWTIPRRAQIDAAPWSFDR